MTCRTIIAALALIGSVSGGPLRADAPIGRYELHPEAVNDLQTGLVWQRVAAPRSIPWKAAVELCRARGADFRLPTLRELLTLVDATQIHPAIDRTAFPDTPAGAFWTASRTAASPDKAWYVDFERGNSGQYGLTLDAYVRCVR